LFSQELGDCCARSLPRAHANLAHAHFLFIALTQGLMLKIYEEINKNPAWQNEASSEQISLVRFVSTDASREFVPGLKGAC
jgi:hypothetical protein